MARRALLADRRFAPLFWCQAAAAFNDNFLKSALAVLLLYTHGPGAAPLVAAAGGVFIAPYLLLSGIAGEIADRSDKARVATVLKAIEIGAGLLAVAGFLAHSVPILFAAMLAFGLLAAFFSPVKYGLLPDLLATEELPLANAMVDFATFLAILAGSALGAALGASAPDVLSAIVVLAALVSFGAATLIPRPGAARPDLPIRANLIASTSGLIGTLRGMREVWRAALVSAWFWFAGVIALTLLPIMVRDTLHRGPTMVTLGLSVFSIGIGAGSFLAAKLMRGTLSLRLASSGSLGVGVLSLALGATAHLPLAATLILLFLLAGAGGLIAVPALASVQGFAPRDGRARAVAGANVLAAAAMVVASIGLTILFHLHATAPEIFGGFGLLTLIALAAAAARPARLSPASRR
jgi:acyl-[acyl-carrier-protein]-phospholipid O-acyltransferase/long-chain-fatty-acid--[acyl-carrier-protein] ligase